MPHSSPTKAECSTYYRIIDGRISRDQGSRSGGRTKSEWRFSSDFLQYQSIIARLYSSLLSFDARDFPVWEKTSSRVEMESCGVSPLSSRCSCLPRACLCCEASPLVPPSAAA